jgi:ABC-type multidrug transport system permease subunit
VARTSIGVFLAKILAWGETGLIIRGFAVIFLLIVQAINQYQGGQ